MKMARTSVDGVCTSKRVASSSPPLLPSLNAISPLPTTHLNNVTTYLSDWRADRRHGRRPQPPTPTRMAAKSRSTSTAIPVPASGTSRRLTSMQKTNKSCLVPLLSPEKARRPFHRRSVGNKADLPPSSYHLPRSLLPRSESLLTDFENDRQFERVFDSPAPPGSKLLGLPKSQTTPALLSPNKDIASHSLLKPIGPPLPRSNTYNDLSTVRAYSNSPGRRQPGTARICFGSVNISERPDIPIARTKSPYPQTSNARLPLRYVPQISTTSLPPYGTDGSVSSIIGMSSSSETDPRFVSS